MFRFETAGERADGKHFAVRTIYIEEAIHTHG